MRLKSLKINLQKNNRIKLNQKKKINHQVRVTISKTRERKMSKGLFRQIFKGANVNLRTSILLQQLEKVHLVKYIKVFWILQERFMHWRLWIRKFLSQVNRWSMLWVKQTSWKISTIHIFWNLAIHFKHLLICIWR